MKKAFKITSIFFALALFFSFLVSCGGEKKDTIKEITKDEFIVEYNKLEISINNFKTNKNIHITTLDSSNENRFEYKENEFFYYKHGSVVLFAPLWDEETVYVDNGKYKRVRANSVDDLEFNGEITKNEFDTKLSDGIKEIADLAKEQFNNLKSFVKELANENEAIQSINSKYTYNESQKIYEFSSKMITKYQSEDTSYTIERTIVYKIKDSLPIYYEYKDGDSSTEKYEYSYGNAQRVISTPRTK